MNDNYNSIIKQLNSKRGIYLFTENELNNLSPLQRADVENRIIRLCKYGVEEAYRYIPFLNNSSILDHLNDDEISKVTDDSKNLIYIYLYIRTKDNSYLRKIIPACLKAGHLKVLLKLFKESKSQSLLSSIKEIISSREDLIEYANIYLGMQNANKTISSEKCCSGIIGFAIGDALGVPVEFTSRESRKNKPIADMIGYGSHLVPEGTWSDDTSMSVAFMDSIINQNGIDYDDIMQRFCNWCNKAEYTATDRVFDIGITTRKALSSYYYKKSDALHSGVKDERSNGNGSLMRMLPVAMYLYVNDFSEKEEVDIINKISDLTHAHEISELGCKIYCDYMKKILSGIDKETAYEELKDNQYDIYYSPESVSKYSRILKDNIATIDEKDISSSGYIVSTLESSLWCTLNSNNYEEAVVRAVNLGEDTDTVGAITGGINGCIYGLNNIPQKWKSKLIKYDYLTQMSINYINTLNQMNTKQNNIKM